MRFLTITGPKDDIDRIMSQYLCKFEIHLENALSELSNVHELKPFVEVNPYKDILEKSELLIEKLNSNTSFSDHSITPENAAYTIKKACQLTDDLYNQKKHLSQKKDALIEIISLIEPFRLLNYEIQKILKFKFLKFRFGKISHQYYNKFSKYVYDNLNTVFLECDSDASYVWGVYFVPASSAVKVDAVFSSLHFERIIIPDGYSGTPEDIYQSLTKKLVNIRQQNRALSVEIKNRLHEIEDDLLLAHQTLTTYNQNFEIRKLAACTKGTKKGVVFYIICGWMTENDAKNFLAVTEPDPDIYIISENDQEHVLTKPPTRLKNPKLFQPFELFIDMYGLPAYNEMDPTIFVALTYTLMFGIMFGDVGQGLCLAIGGFLLYWLKKMNLGAIIGLAGIWSTIFGFFYGSIFGFEEIIPALWRKPMDNIMSTLLTSIGFGIGLIIFAMILNIINGIRSKNIEKVFFDPSGLAGLICYSLAVLLIILALTGRKIPGSHLSGILLCLPLAAIFLKEPFTHLVQKQKKIFPPGSKSMFFIEGLVELFDVVLSYATNTISFVRVGAFALSHAGMMGVVLSLADTASGTPNVFILIIGNIAVTALEGLVVGIQVLRLEYYEMFSRFYRGTGKTFKPFNSKFTN
ncbi:V-type ATP synthase subunit I [Anaeromicropila populeti]|nr:V-type ATPase 116kDa subunit family protein [Anaeromicropila populeti]